MAGPLRLKERVSSLFLGCAFCLLVLEVSLRVLGVVCEHRDSAAPAPAAGDTCTILCVGDSFTWGAGASASMSWPRQLERLLNAEGQQRYTVVNRGVGGQNSARLVQAFQNNLDSVRPRLVILCTGANNQWDAYGSDRENEAGTWRGTVRDALYRIRVFKLARLMYLAARDAYAREQKARYLAALEAGRKAFQENVERTVSADLRLQSQACSQRGFRLLGEDKCAEAMQCFRDGMDANPFDAENYVGMVRCGEIQQAPADVKDWCQKCIQANPYDVRPHAAMARALLAERRAVEALQWLEQAREISPRDPLVLRFLASAYASEQRFAEALECARLAVEAGGERVREMRLDTAVIYMQMNEHDKAIAELRTVLATTPTDERCWTTLGDIHCRTGNYRQAIECYQQAITCHRADSHGNRGHHAYLGLGDCYHELHATADALKCYEKAALLSPQDGAEKLADAYREADMEVQAQAWYRKAMEVRPERAAMIRSKLAGPTVLPLATRPGGTVSSLVSPRAMPPASAPLSPTEAWVQADIGKVIAMCRKAGVPVLMHGYPAGTIQHVLVRAARENDVLFIDHQAVFLGLQDPARYFVPDLHCNELGYGVMARTLQPKVVEMLSALRRAD